MVSFDARSRYMPETDHPVSVDQSGSEMKPILNKSSKLTFLAFKEDLSERIESETSTASGDE